MNRFRWMSLLSLIVLFAPVALAQTTPQATITDAERAVTAAENVGAPVYAKDLYDEALVRLNMAKQTIGDDRQSVRENARLRAVEARHAARAAEAKARWVVNSTEARNLRDDITRFGGRAAELSFPEEVPDITRGANSVERVNFAQGWVDRAKAAGGQLVAPEDMKNAQAWLTSARRIARSDKQNDSADHLAYTAEMMARRAYYLALRGEVDRVLPSLRLERTRLAQAATERAAEEERQRRERAERELAEMRQRVDAEAANRAAQQQELDALRMQLQEREIAQRAQLEADRQARLEAEQRLYDLVARYEAALARADQTEVEALRRQVEDQRMELQASQERQRLSEQSLTAETMRLQQELERARTSGKQSVEALAQQEAELNRRQLELERLRNEREESMRRSRETEQRLAETARRAQEAEAESERLRAEMAEAQRRAQQAQQQAADTQRELERVRAERDRLARMQQAVGPATIVRTEARGMVVTLPGIFFDTGKSTLKAGARNILSKMANEIKDGSSRIAVEGHTDSTGSEETNLELSRRRAEAVRDLLVSSGVDASRITIEGKGEAAPIATNDTVAGRQQNRRVEIVITQ